MFDRNDPADLAALKSEQSTGPISMGDEKGITFATRDTGEKCPVI